MSGARVGREGDQEISLSYDLRAMNLPESGGGQKALAQGGRRSMGGGLNK